MGVGQKNTTSSGIFRLLCIGEEWLSVLETISIESSETKKQRKQWLKKTDENSKDCGTTAEDMDASPRKRKKNRKK